MKIAVFDIDGTLARVNGVVDGPDLLFAPSYPNVVQLCRQYMARPDTRVMICTGRPKSLHTVSWRWLNRTLRVSESDSPVLLSCRPDDSPASEIPSYKLRELVRIVRRHSPTDLAIYDDDVRNLRLFGTLAPMVANLRLFRVEDGVAASWSL